MNYIELLVENKYMQNSLTQAFKLHRVKFVTVIYPTFRPVLLWQISFYILLQGINEFSKHDKACVPVKLAQVQPSQTR